MRVRLLAITHKTPDWVKKGYEEYAKRLLGSELKLELIDIPAEKRSAGSHLHLIQLREEKKILNTIKSDHHVIALDRLGMAWDTQTLADELKRWQTLRKPIDLIIGGPEGLTQPCLDRAQQKWSLSALTFPHFLVKIIVAEQLYRAYTILKNHPYHR